MGYGSECYHAEAIPPMPLWQGREFALEILSLLGCAEKRATRANPKDASIDGLAYVVSRPPQQKDSVVLRIHSWRFTYCGNATDLPIMEFIFYPHAQKNLADAIESLKIMARPVYLTEIVALRALDGALFLINKINAGDVPDYEQVLDSYHLHPDRKRAGLVVKKGLKS